MSVNGKELGSGKEGIMNLVNIIQKSSGEELLFERVKEGESETITIIPAENEGNGRRGAPMMSRGGGHPDGPRGRSPRLVEPTGRNPGASVGVCW